MAEWEGRQEIDDDFEDIPEVTQEISLDQEEALLEQEIATKLQIANLQSGDSDDEDETRKGSEVSSSGSVFNCIEMSAGGVRSGPGVRMIPTEKLNALLEQQEMLRKRLHLLERKKQLEEKLRLAQLEQQKRKSLSLSCKTPRTPDTYRHLVEVGDGFWNVRGRFTVLGGMLNLGTHMSVCRRANGRFIIIDTIKLCSDAVEELNHLTNGGKDLDAVIATHPYHTLAFRDFYGQFPNVDYYGTPRHLNTIPDIPWKGEVMANKQLFAPDVDLRIPAGSEYVLPLPPRSNHFSNVFVFHPQSKTIHNDDCVVCFESPPLLLRMMGIKDGDMMFHPSMKGPGLHPTPEAPRDFQNFVEGLIEDWDFDNICTAHNGNCLGGAKQKLMQTLQKAEPVLKKLAAKNCKRRKQQECGAWSSDPRDPPECG